MTQLDRLAQRHTREQTIRDRNEAARRDIAKGLPRDVVIAAHGLSRTAYEQLASQVRGPRGAWRAA
jgi:hypothetical protein